MFSSLLVLALLTASPQATRAAEEGVALANEGKLVPAVQKFEQAHRLDPKDATIAFNLAQLYEATGVPAKAVALYAKYLELSPDAPDAASVRQHVQELRAGGAAAPATAEAPAPAAPAEDEALDGPEDAKRLMLRGRAYVAEKRYAEAEAEFKRAEAAAPRWGAPVFNLGVLYEAQGRNAEAVEYLKKYQKLAPRAERAQVEERLTKLEIRLEDQRREEQARAERAEAERRELLVRQEQERAAQARKAVEDAYRAKLAVYDAAVQRRDGARGQLVAAGVFAGLGVGMGLLGVWHNAAVKGAPQLDGEGFAGVAARGLVLNLASYTSFGLGGVFGLVGGLGMRGELPPDPRKTPPPPAVTATPSGPFDFSTASR